MIVRPTRSSPVTRPRLADAKVIGDVTLERGVLVVVGALSFAFERGDDGGDWEGGDATTAARGHDLDEAYVTAARGVAFEAMRAEILRVTGEGEVVVETVRCPDCGHLMSSRELVVANNPVVSFDCGPVHVLHFGSDQELRVRPDGTAAWWPDSGLAEQPVGGGVEVGHAT